MEGFGGVDRSLYEDPETVARYGPDGGLQAPEAVILERIGQEVGGSAVLDIGIGGGRTVIPLRAIAGRYVGLDYSEAMVAVASRQHPDADIRHGDVRDLSAFEDASFRLVVFSFNGIDSISHEDRLVALGEIHRVLEVGGLFVFSSHNDAYRPSLRKLWLDELDIGHDPIRSPVRLLLSIPRVVRRVRNHLRHRGQTTRNPSYSIKCDGGFDHTALCYCVTRAGQVEELSTAGFSTEGVYALDGGEASPASDDQWLYFLARAIDPI
jgi:SAM-dependent methyltransferase